MNLALFRPIALPAMASCAIGLLAFAATSWKSAHESQRIRFRVHPAKLVLPLSLDATRFRYVLAIVSVISVDLMALVSYGVGLFMVVVILEAISVCVTRGVLARRSVRRYERDLPIALDSLSRSMRSGAGFLVALQETSVRSSGSLGADLAIVVREISLGKSTVEALEAWGRRRETVEVTLAVGAMTLGLESGAAHAQIIDTVAATVRQSLAARAMARTHAQQAQSSATALTALPVVVTGMALVGSEHVRTFLFRQPAGLVVLLTGMALDGVGAWWMYWLIRKAAA